MYTMIREDRRREVEEAYQHERAPHWVHSWMFDGFYRMTGGLFPCPHAVAVVNAFLHQTECAREARYFGWCRATPEYWWHDESGRPVPPRWVWMPPAPRGPDDAAFWVEWPHKRWQSWHDRLAWQRAFLYLAM